MPVFCIDPILKKAKKAEVFLERKKPSKLDPIRYEFIPYPDCSERNHIFTRDDDAKIDCIILHHTVENLERTLTIFTRGTEPKVNAHYIITEKEKNVPAGQVIQMMDPNNMARHAGISCFRGKEAYNQNSIGIELINPGVKKYITADNKVKYCFPPYDTDQIDILICLLKKLCKEYNIPVQNIFSHGDVAPQRKDDVNIAFPWGRLYRIYGLGMGLTPKELEESQKSAGKKLDKDLFIQALKNFGYDFSFYTKNNNAEEKAKLQNVFNQFYAHFSRNGEIHRCSGEPDSHDMAWAVALAEKYPYQILKKREQKAALK